MSSKRRGPGSAIEKGRFEAFSDGVFAIAITLLVLEFRPPDLKTVSDDALLAAVLAMWPQFVVYVASFLTIGIMWFNHYALFHNERYVLHGTLIANLALLLLICFLPFTTLLIGRFGLLPSTVEVYGATMLAIAIAFNVLQYFAAIAPGQRPSLIEFIRRRNLWNSIGPPVYLAGTIVGEWSPLAAVALFGLMAVFYMLPSSVAGALAGAPTQPDDAP